jgi:hypothetical protein
VRYRHRVDALGGELSLGDGLVAAEHGGQLSGALQRRLPFGSFKGSLIALASLRALSGLLGLAMLLVLLILAELLGLIGHAETATPIRTHGFIAHGMHVRQALIALASLRALSGLLGLVMLLALLALAVQAAHAELRHLSALLANAAALR